MGHNQSVSAKDLINVNSPYSPYKEPIFEGSQRVVAYLILLSVSTLSLAAQSVFLLVRCINGINHPDVILIFYFIFSVSRSRLK